MKATFEKQITIRFWFEHSDNLESLMPKQRDELEEKAKKSIFNFIINDGFTSGELIECVDDTTFYGWWTYRIVNL